MNGDSLRIGKTLASITAMEAGLKAAPPAGLTALGIGGKSYAIADVETQLAQYAALLSAVVAAQQALVAAQQALAPSAAGIVSFASMTRAAIKTALGNQSPALASYGITPNKTPIALTTEQKAARNAKVLATRAARHTMGARQKAAVKGVVPTAPTTSSGATPAVAPAAKTGA